VLKRIHILGEEGRSKARDEKWLARLLLLLVILMPFACPHATLAAPEKSLVFRDGRVQLQMRYREGTAWVGDDKNATIVTSGTLSLTFDGQTWLYDLAALHLKPGNWYFVTSPGGACGSSAHALGRYGDYAYVEIMRFGKGCGPAATLIELSTGRVVERAIIDHPWDHRYAAVVPVFRAHGTLRVDAVARVDGVARAEFARGPVTIIRAGGTGAAGRVFAVEAPGATIGLRVGQLLLYGTLDYAGPATDDAVALRYDAPSERRFEGLQTPTPAFLVKRFQRNSLVAGAQDDATRGDFTGALNKLTQAVVLDQDQDVGYLDEDEPNLERCRAMAERVWAGNVPASTMSAQWKFGCRPDPSQSVRPVGT
jgi:hypothetical protein